VVEVLDEDEDYSAPAFERLQSTGLLVNDGSWHHVALTHDGTTATLMVDSAEAAAVTLPAKLQGDLMFMSLHAGYFHGALDELRVWDAAYTAAEVAAVAGAVALQADSLLSWYPFSDSVTATGVAEDVVGGFHLTVSEGSLIVEGSSAPVSTVLLQGVEDQALPVGKLGALMGSTPGTDETQFAVMLMTLPDQGTLLLDGKPVTMVPFRVQSDNLSFVPAAGAHDVGGAAYAAFTYATYDGSLSNPDPFLLQSVPVLLSIAAVKDLPMILAVTPSTLAMGSLDAPTMIVFNATDTDLATTAGEATRVVFGVTELPPPVMGTLHNVLADSTAGPSLTPTSRTITDVVVEGITLTATLLYAPHDLYAYTTQFAVGVADADGAASTVTVPVAVSYDPYATRHGGRLALARSTAFATAAGRALLVPETPATYLLVDTVPLAAGLTTGDITVELMLQSRADN
jgi:hypothetical protein